MPSIASILKQEIARVARKEVRHEIAALKKATANHRSEIAALKRRVAEAERKPRAGEPRPSPPSAHAAANDESTPEGLRFSAKGLVAHRSRLGLSAAELGLLLGVSTQTIYNWESGKVRPHRRLLPTLVALRTVGKKATTAHLEEVKKAA
jgi:DNA-binding transcriptional regulator YiaG